MLSNLMVVVQPGISLILAEWEVGVEDVAIKYFLVHVKERLIADFSLAWADNYWAHGKLIINEPRLPVCQK